MHNFYDTNDLLAVKNI